VAYRCHMRAMPPPVAAEAHTRKFAKKGEGKAECQPRSGRDVAAGRAAASARYTREGSLLPAAARPAETAYGSSRCNTAAAYNREVQAQAGKGGRQGANEEEKGGRERPGVQW